MYVSIGTDLERGNLQLTETKKRRIVKTLIKVNTRKAVGEKISQALNKRKTRLQQVGMLENQWLLTVRTVRQAVMVMRRKKETAQEESGRAGMMKVIRTQDPVRGSITALRKTAIAKIRSAPKWIMWMMTIGDHHIRNHTEMTTMENDLPVAKK